MGRKEMRRQPVQTGVCPAVCHWSDSRTTGAFAQPSCPPDLCRAGLNGTGWGMSKVTVLLPPRFLPLEQPLFAVRGSRVWNKAGKNMITAGNDLE